MVERFLEQNTFTSQEDFKQHLKIKVPDNFNFGYDIVDKWAEEEPDRKALLWTNDQGEHIQFTYADLKRETDKVASYLQSLGIGHGDMVMLILKRRYEFWLSMIALHKLGAVVIPATFLLTKKDIVYRCNAASIKAILVVGDEPIITHVKDALPDSPTVEQVISIGPLKPEGFKDFQEGVQHAAPFVRPSRRTTNRADVRDGAARGHARLAHRLHERDPARREGRGGLLVVRRRIREARRADPDGLHGAGRRRHDPAARDRPWRDRGARAERARRADGQRPAEDRAA